MRRKINCFATNLHSVSWVLWARSERFSQKHLRRKKLWKQTVFILIFLILVSTKRQSRKKQDSATTAIADFHKMNDFFTFYRLHRFSDYRRFFQCSDKSFSFISSFLRLMDYDQQTVWIFVEKISWQIQIIFRLYCLDDTFWKKRWCEVFLFMKSENILTKIFYW